VLNAFKIVVVSPVFIQRLKMAGFKSDLEPAPRRQAQNLSPFSKIKCKIKVVAHKAIEKLTGVQPTNQIEASRRTVVRKGVLQRSNAIVKRAVKLQTNTISFNQDASLRKQQHTQT
jgi:hypothetical protein